MRNQAKWCAIAVSLMATSGVAQPLYKSVNEQGEVTFSDSPPPSAVEVQEIQLQPGPSEAQQQESIERAKRIESQASDLGDANAARAQQRKDAQWQSQQQARETEVQPLTDYNDGYRYPNRPLYPPVIRPPVEPERPLLPGRPGRPVQLPATPVVPPRL
jgi:long-subunit acyl-CoA synthetase (AMP-forming)